jgi:hypothetical protein
MPSVYTIEGTSPSRRKSRSKRKRKGLGSPAQRAQQNRMVAANKKCKGKKGQSRKSCMRKALSR